MSELLAGIAGLGTIGKELATRLSRDVAGVTVGAVAARDENDARTTLAQLGIDADVVDFEELARRSDVVIECAPARLLTAIAEPVLRAGKELITLSAGALLTSPELIELATSHGGRITVPSGALLGLDAVGAAAEGEIRAVRMTTRKPPGGLAGAPFVESAGIDLAAIAEPTLIFEGSARDAAAGFPANVNVAVALALAGIGPDLTTIEIWADPTLERNTHTIDVVSDVAEFSMTIANVPSENPRTGRITALSVVSLLRKRVASLRVGS
ncbi:MAG: aspartate dehydrogenase [Gaiellaceae bacterium]